MLLRAIRAVWEKERCQMNVQYDHEKSWGDTYYIPITLFTCMKEQFPLLMWAEMFQTSPQSAIYHGPSDIMVAIEKCLRGDQDPWKDARVAIGDGPRMLSLTNQSDHAKKSTKRPQPDTRSEDRVVDAPHPAGLVHFRRTPDRMGGLHFIMVQVRLA